MAQLYPWLEGVWKEWQESLETDRFSNASILSVDDGLGAERLVELFSRAVMCSNYTTEACGFCHSCQLMNSGSHPDYHVIRPEKEGKAISVDQIRQCNRLAQESSQLAGVRLFIIEPAESMNESAANALLKTLEEPSGNCLFLLVSHRANLLLPTIVSRCQQWVVSNPASSEVTSWLAQQAVNNVPAYASHINNNAPLKALDFVEQGHVESYQKLEHQLLELLKGQGDVLKLAKELAVNPHNHLQWVWYLLTDAQKVHFSVSEPFFTPGSNALAQYLNYDLLYQQTINLSELIEQLREHPGLNCELLVLDWLFKFKEESCL